jgi:hypothetical protein
LGRLDGEFGGGGREQAGPRFAGIERGAQRRFGLGQAFAATSANAKFSGQIAQIAGAAFDGVADLPIRNCFAYTNYHWAIVNANANDCQYQNRHLGMLQRQIISLCITSFQCDEMTGH